MATAIQPTVDLDLLARIEDRVLWLSTWIIHYANYIRSNPDAMKLGGHEASSASMVTLMTALYFRELCPGDLVAVKPHASPVFHAIQYLLGNLSEETFRKYRSFHGLQAYPSRTKDPDAVDFTTGSVGLGAVTPGFAALVRQFVENHFGPRDPDRFIALTGDAELDEGNVWEAVTEDGLRRVGRLWWIIDLNRQSLDRVVPSGKAQRIEQMFRVHDWHVIELKYGKKLETCFARSNGWKLRRRIDLMSNDEYQALLRIEDGEIIRRKIAAGDPELAEVIADCPAGEVCDLIANLGGHDLEKILDGFAEANQVQDRPVVIVAYTVKGWGLPLAGDPLNHSKLLTPGQMEFLRERLGVSPGSEFARFDAQTAEGRFIHRRREALVRRPAPASEPSPVPDSLGQTYRGDISTQQALGAMLVSLSRVPEVARRMVTTSPDVAISTNLGGWIQKLGVYSSAEEPDYFRENDIALLLNWERGPKGHHIELGISENNFFLLLNMLGLGREFSGETLLPLGTIYDSFISRGLDALTYSAYNESKFIFAGTPSGVSLSPEGGLHQSFLTPSVGIEMPNLVYYEPCFAQELEWILLAALRQLLDRKRGQIVYLRLSTVPVDQSLFPGSALREQVLRGGYRLLDWRGEDGYDPARNVVNLFACGVITPVAVEAARGLRQEGLFANVINVTSPDLLYRGWVQATRIQAAAPAAHTTCHLGKLIPAAERRAPIVSVLDGHSHSLAFLGSVFGARAAALGVDEFGQTGSRRELYDHYGIGADAICRAAKKLLSRDLDCDTLIR